MTPLKNRPKNVHLLTITNMTPTVSSSSQTLADSAPQLAQHDHLCACSSSFNGTALPDPTHLRPSPAKGRSRADRRLLSELGRVKTRSTRRSSHKAMAKRMFFLLSGRRRMRKLVPPSYELVLLLSTRSTLLSRYPLPSFRDAFTEWVPDTEALNPTPLALPVNGFAGWQEKAVSQLPSVFTLLGSER